MYSLNKFPTIIKNWVWFQFQHKFSKETNEKNCNYHLGENGT